MTLLYHQLMSQAVMQNDAVLLKVLRKCGVFDLSDSFEILLEIAESDKNCKVPKRPPFEATWMEWSRPNVIKRFSDGVVVNTHTTEGVVFLTEWKEWEIEESLAALINEYAKEHELPEMVNFVPVLYFERLNKRDIPGSTPIGVPIFANFMIVVGFTDDWLSCVSCGQSAGTNQLFKTAATCYPDVSGKVAELYAKYVWPAILACALLNCKNISTETITPAPLRPRLIRQGHEPRKSYKVLRLELPAEIRPHGVTDSPESERKMRFHLCRGHFKNLQHDRYKSKGWHWWPAHWKGSKSLGYAEKHYELRDNHA